MNIQRIVAVWFGLGVFGQAVLAHAQEGASGPLGVWRGNSSCLVRPSACNDENVVYRITRAPSRDSVAFDARKIVNGKEVEMGVLRCRVASPGTQITCAIPNGVWHFSIRGDSLVGELRLSDSTRFRDVRTARSRE